MPEEFDPYSHWLGIQAHERPIDHYRLLGITRFAADPSVIVDAADERMALIRTFQTGPRGRLTQPLLNEIAAAKLCLLNPSAKAAYDAMLEGLAAATTPPPITTGPPPPTPPPRMAAGREVRPAGTANRRGDSARPFVQTSDDEPRASSGNLVWLVLATLVIAGVGSYVTWRVVSVGNRPGTVHALAAGGDAPLDAADPAVSDPPSDQASRDPPTVVFQETDGSVNLTPPVAQLVGEPLRLRTVGITDTLTGWSSPSDTARWQCNVVKLPPNGVFRVLVTYLATPDADAGIFRLAINGHEKQGTVRGQDNFVTDELYLPVTRAGEQTVELRGVELPGGMFELRGVRLVMASRDAG